LENISEPQFSGINDGNLILKIYFITQMKKKLESFEI